MRRWWTFAALTALLAGAFLYRPVLPSFCTMKRVTGIGCPGCGMTRSVCATARGDVRTALRFHLFGPAVFLASVLLWVAALFGRVPRIEDRRVHRVVAGIVLVLMAYWIVRVAMGTVP
jgi:hypothetical protein